MGKATVVPITPSVLTWAIRESGYSPEEVAAKAEIPLEELSAWKRGEPPPLTKFRRLAGVLKRTVATFLLPSPPSSAPSPVQFRRVPGIGRTTLNPVERRYLREASRIQKATAWLAGKLGRATPSLPTYKLSTDAERASDSVRHSLRSYLSREPRAQPTPAQAFDAWRDALERWGVLVFLFPLGKNAAQGFSLWDEKAPLIAVNTFWNDAARIFTLFHELGHLLTRTSSVCVERSASKFTRPSDATERWCEQFAAAVLIPWTEVEEFLGKRFEWRPGTLVEDLSVSRAIANRFKVSWRAATLRLIERKAAKWDLYGMIPTASETKIGGGGGSGRNRREIKEDQYGKRATDMFVQAYQKRMIGRTDVLDYLDLTDNGLSQLQGAPRLE